MVTLIILAALPALLFVLYLAYTIKNKDPGTTHMQEVSAAIKQGAQAFLTRKYTILPIFTIILTLIISIFINYQTGATYIFGFSFGASSIAIFLSVGGSIYTKAAVIGDTVGDPYKRHIQRYRRTITQHAHQTYVYCCTRIPAIIPVTTRTISAHHTQKVYK